MSSNNHLQSAGFSPQTVSCCLNYTNYPKTDSRDFSYYYWDWRYSAQWQSVKVRNLSGLHYFSIWRQQQFTSVKRAANNHHWHNMRPNTFSVNYFKPSHQLVRRIWELQLLVLHNCNTGVLWHTWMYSVRVLKTCLATFIALEKFLWPCSSITSFPE